MATDENSARPAFSWNVGGWFGSQLGCTLWMLILGLVLLSKDLLSGFAGIAGFVLLNAWGLFLWRSRAHLSAYAGIQRFLLAASIVFAMVVLVVDVRGVLAPFSPGALVSTYLPYWLMAVPLGLMFFFFLLNRPVKRNKE